MVGLIKSEPVMFQAVIQALLAMVVGFGVHWTAGQMADVLAFTAAVLALWTRQNVTPVMNGGKQ